MTDRKYLDNGRPWFNPILKPLFESVEKAIEAGETDLDAIVAKAAIASNDPLCQEFCTDPDGLRSQISTKLSTRQAKIRQAEAEARRQQEREREKAAVASRLEAKQKAMLERKKLPPKPAGVVSPRGKFRPLARDARYRINQHGEVVGPQGKTLKWEWDLVTGVPYVKVGGRRARILSLLQDAGFQKTKDRPSTPKAPPAFNDTFEAGAEDPEANPPQGYDSWAEARAEDPETYGMSE